MPSSFTIKTQALPKGPVTPPYVTVEGHVFDPDTDLPWLAHLVLHRNTYKVRTRAMGIGRDELAALLRFVAENDPGLYDRSGTEGHRARRRNKTR
jgi:hypothetical protein